MTKKFQCFSNITKYFNNIIKVLSNNYNIKKEIKKSLYQNERFLRFRWNWFEKCIIYLSIHYKRSICTISIIIILLSILFIIFKSSFKELALIYFPFWSNLLNWQQTFLGSQLTIIAVIYPLVIGLISVLIQNKSSKKIIYYIYQLYSGFMFSGLSGLLLSIYIILGMLSKTALSDSSYAIVCLISAVWVLINIVLTIWFFTQTFRFLFNDTQNKVILCYLIYEAGQQVIEQSTSSKHSVESINVLTAAPHDALKNNDKIEFKEAIDILAKWHVNITQSFYYQNEGKKNNRLHYICKGNYSYFNSMLNRYWSLIEECISMVPSNQYFYEVILYLHSKIYCRQPNLTDIEIKQLIEADYHIWTLLMNNQKNNPQLENTKKPNAYKNLVRKFISMWEGWISTIRIYQENVNNDLSLYALALITHLKCTTLIIIESLHIDNKEALEHGIDTLIHWFYHFIHIEPSDQSNFWSQLISYDFIEKERLDSFQEFILNKNENDNKVILNHAFKNTHLDLRIITACLILIGLKPENKDNKRRYIISLLEGKLLKPIGHTFSDNSIIRDVNNLFSAYMRHLFSYDKNQSYGVTMLVEMVEKFRDITTEAEIPGRNILIPAITNLDTLNNAYVEIFISYSNHEWQLSKEQEEIIFSNALTYDNRQLLIDNLKKWLDIAKEKNLDYSLISKENHENNKRKFISSMEKLTHSMQKHQIDIIIQSKIDPKILTQIAICNSRFINENPLKFPINLFKNINKNKEMNAQDHRTLEFAYDKLWLIQVSKNISSLYNNVYYSRCLHQNASETILHSLFEYQIFKSIQYNNTKEFFEEIKKISCSIANPILFIGCPKETISTRHLTHEPTLRDKYNIHTRDGYGEHYLCHIGKCEIYSITPFFTGLTHSILTSQDIFKSLHFKEIAENQYVHVDFENSGTKMQNELSGSLKLTYGMKVELEENIKCIKFELVPS